MKNVESVALRVLWTMMLLCAGTVLIMIWFGEGLEHTGYAWVFRLAPTLFVIGFASFLIWAPLMVYKFYAKLQ